MKRLLALILSLICIGGMLSGCNNENIDGGLETDSEATANTPKELIIAENGKSEFTVRVADELNSSSDKLKEAVSSLTNTIFEVAGVRLSVSTDKRLKEADAEKPAILIGRTKDAEAQAIGTMRIDEFTITLSGNKIVLCADHAEGAVKAIKYFINKVVTPQKKKSALVFNDDHCYAYTEAKHGIKSINCLGAELGTYRIVIPSDADINERMTANILRHHLIESYAYDLQIVSDSEEAAEREILIGNTLRTTAKPEADNYVISAGNGKLQINADGMLGYEALTDYLRNSFFMSGNNKEYTIEEGFCYNGKLTVSLDDGTHFVTNRYGNVRCMFNNIYGWPSDAGPVNVKQDIQIEVFEAYLPDVIGMQEYSTYYRGSFDAKLAKLGYTKVEVSDTDNWVPLYYRDDVLDVLDKGFLRYDTDGVDASKSVSWALFETKNGDRFIAMSTHFMWDDPAVADPNAVRRSNATELLALIGSLKEQYGVPMIVGGDFNCTAGSAPMEALSESIYLAQVSAEIKNDSSGIHGYPTYDETYGYYTSSVAPIGRYSSSIDHILTTDNVTVNAFGTACSAYTLYTSDHSPLLVDISFEQ